MSVIFFPLFGQAGRIRRVAATIRSRETVGDARAYQQEMKAALVHEMTAAGVDAVEQGKQLVGFWSAVVEEMIRQNRQNRRPGGNAA